MKRRWIAPLFLVVSLMSVAVSADDRGGSKSIPPVSNQTYRQACGSCHFAYQPGLLPASGWAAIMDDPGVHPGGALSLDDASRSEIKAYLRDNSAEKSPSKRSRKILEHAGRTADGRVSQNPYIREKHDEISPDVFSRKAIGSRGNCPACHRSAERGIYDDDDVVIPK